MEKNDYNFNEKINIIYEYLYNNANKSCFTVDKINLGEIGLPTIKLSIPEDKMIECYNGDMKKTTCSSNIDMYNNIKSQILTGKFKLLNYNDDMKQFTLKRYSDELPLLVKITFYKNEKSINMINSPVNNDSLFSYLLSGLVLSQIGNNKTRHILLPIINIDMKYEDIDKYIDKNIKNDIINNLVTDTVCVQIREHFYNTVLLLDYIKDNLNTKTIKLLFFQVFHTLALLQKNYAGFKHNNLTLNNILLYLKQKSDSYNEYYFNDNIYYIPNSDFDIKITNFEYSIIPKYYMNKSEDNLKNDYYYDVYTFLFDLINNIKLLSLKINKETEEFLERIIPSNIRGSKTFSNIIKPEDIINDKYFNEYTVKPKNITMDDFLIYLTNKSIKTVIKDNKKILGNQNKYKLLSNNNIMESKRFIKSDKNVNKLSRVQNIDLIGGDDKNRISSFKPESSGPFISNDMKNVKSKSFTPKPKELPVLLEQKIYDTTKSKPEPPKPYEPYIPVFPDNLANNLLPYTNTFKQPNVQKIYNVSLTNPVGNYTTINRIYEDELIGDSKNFTFATIFERTQLIDYLYNNIIKKTNGEEMDITGGDNSFLEYIKLENNPNPYSSSKYPLTDLAKNFLIYRAGYPIKFDSNTRIIGMNKDSMGINVRIYMMTIGDYRAKTINNKINPDNFDLWREIKYYDTVRTILNKKISPNFIAPILWKIDSKSRIIWGELEQMKSKNISFDNLNNIKLNQELINNKHELNNFLVYPSNIKFKRTPLYIIDRNNNTFKLIEGTVENTITIPEGKYELDDIINILNSILRGFNYKYTIIK